MTALVANILSTTSSTNLFSQAFTHYTGIDGGPIIPPFSDNDHVEAEAWLFNPAGSNFNPLQDRLVIAGHSYGGNRARLFANQIQKNRGVMAKQLVLVDPIDWRDCYPGNDTCHQDADGRDRFYVTPADATIVYYQTTSSLLHGYQLRGATNHKLSLEHYAIDDAEFVHRQIVNSLQPTFAAPPPFAVDLSLSRGTPFLPAYDTNLVVFPVDLANIGAFLASNISVANGAAGSTLTTFGPDGRTETVPLLDGGVSGLPNYVCSQKLFNLGYVCPGGTGASIQLKFPKPSNWGQPNVTWRFKLNLVSNGIQFIRNYR